MSVFLDKISSYLIDNHLDSLDKVCVVLPNRRAGLFLKKYLSQRINKPIWMPTVFGVEDFILEYSGFQLLDPVALLFELYETHRDVEKENADTFDEFIHWGKVLLSDFNEIDQYLIDPKKLFSYLNDVKAMAVWNLDQKPLTPFEKKYLKFFNSLYQYYSLFSTKLLEKKQVYKGLAYRILSENIEAVEKKLPFQKVIFSGFNALTTSEEQIIKFLISTGKAEIFWDIDEYYFKNPDQEAGKFFREYDRKTGFGHFRWVADNFHDSDKEITVIGVPQKIGQAKIMGEVLSTYKDSGMELEKTAVVLADETLLNPVLNSLPPEIEDFNVTMGYSLRYTPLYELFESVFALHENAERFSHLPSSRTFRFYYKDVYRVLNHPYLMFIAETPDTVRGIINDFQAGNHVFLSEKDLENAFDKKFADHNKLLQTIFIRWNNSPGKALETITILIETLRDKLLIKGKENKNSDIELEYLYHFSLIFKRIRTLLVQYPVIDTVSNLRSIYKQVVGASSIPFYGEPLKGLQVMGMLETRTLGFENIILLSVNDDIIPSGKSINSFIPFDIKRDFKLPTYRDRNAIFAYHFYRLLQHGKRIFLLYNTESDSLGGGEKSRFITQLLHELPIYNPEIKITEKLFHLLPQKESRDFTITIEKDEHINELLLEKAEKGLSPSSLNVYRNCSLQFYFQYIARLRDIDEVEETIEAATLGTVVHEVMRELYYPYIDNVLTPEMVTKMISEVAAITDKAFRQHYRGGDLHYGKNLLIVNVARRIITNFLKKEISFLESIGKKGDLLTIIHLEEPLDTIFPVDIGDSKIEVKIKGTTDRIDKQADVYRVIDYKTGRVKPGDLKIKDWESMESDPRNDKSFQVLTYAFLFLSQPGFSNAKVKPGIISFKSPSAGLMDVKLPDTKLINSDSLDEFRVILGNLLSEIFDKHTPFSQTPEPDNCKWCPFKGICNR